MHAEAAAGHQRQIFEAQQALVAPKRAGVVVEVPLPVENRPVREHLVAVPRVVRLASLVGAIGVAAAHQHSHQPGLTTTTPIGRPTAEGRHADAARWGAAPSRPRRQAFDKETRLPGCHRSAAHRNGQLQTLTNDRSTAYRPNPAAQVQLRDRQKGQDAYSFDLYFSGFLAVLDTVGADGVAQLAFRPQR